jgi:two-component system phosphate regulon sensor histidine kinase PhoR
MEQGHVQLSKETINISSYLDEFASECKNLVEQKQGAFNYHNSLEDIDIQADSTHLKNVLYNLVDNALKYSGSHPSISLSAFLQKGNVHIHINDQGIGIEKSQIGKLFDKFFRVSTGNIHNAKGFGLGLYYVKIICDAHDWEISVDSILHQGSSFKIIIKPIATS